VEEVIYEPD
jgi:hypothetical protein